MKIIQAVGWYLPDSLGGTEIYVAALARAHRAAGHEVLVAAPDASLAEPRTYEYEGVQVFRYPVPAQPTRDEAQGRVQARGSETFHQWLTIQKPDVVHMHTFVTGLGLFEIRAARQAGARVFVTTHSSSLGFLCQRGTLMEHGQSLCDGLVSPARCATCVLEQHGLSRGAAAAISRVSGVMPGVGAAVPGRVGTALGMTELIESNLARQREMLGLVERFVVLTARAARIVVANGAAPERVAVNRLGVAHTLDTPPEAGDLGLPIRVGYLGRFDAIKGVLDLAAAVRRLPAEVPVLCEFRGPVQTPACRAVRDALVEIARVDPRIRVGDAVAPEHVPALLRSYHVTCFPSRCLEGGPTAGLESLAAGTPVIAADAGGVAEVLKDHVTGRLVAPGDVEGLAAILSEMAADPQGTVRRWRQRIAPPRTMADVARDYANLYQPSGYSFNTCDA